MKQSRQIIRVTFKLCVFHVNGNLRSALDISASFDGTVHPIMPVIHSP